MKVRGDLLGPPRSTDKTTLIIKVSKDAKIRNRYNQVPHLTQDTYKNLILVINLKRLLNVVKELNTAWVSCDCMPGCEPNYG